MTDIRKWNYSCFGVNLVTFANFPLSVYVAITCRQFYWGRSGRKGRICRWNFDDKPICTSSSLLEIYTFSVLAVVGCCRNHFSTLFWAIHSRKPKISRWNVKLSMLYVMASAIYIFPVSSVISRCRWLMKLPGNTLFWLYHYGWKPKFAVGSLTIISVILSKL